MTTLTLREAVEFGFSLACRPEGVDRQLLVTMLDGNIGWRKYFTRLGEAEGLSLNVTKTPGLPVHYRLVADDDSDHELISDGAVA